MLKSAIVYIILLLSCAVLNAQANEQIKKIDSIKSLLNNSKDLDSLSLAKEHYKIGELYRYSLLNDSAYFYYHKAEKTFKKFSKRYETAITLYGIGVIQSKEKDYTGSEVTCIEAISLLEGLEQTNNVRKYTSFIYNVLGIVFDELQQFDESIDYFKKSLKLKRGLQGNFSRSIGLTLNNLLKVYRRSGQYDLAIETYNEILSTENLIKNYPSVHVLALGNYARTLYESGDLNELPGLYLKGIKICDSIGDSYNSIIIFQHLAEYYNNRNLDSALYYGYKSKHLSEKYANDDLLKSLLLLSKIERGNKANEYLRDYVMLNDSLQRSERATRNKFARIRFETSQKEKENIQLARERTWLLIISVVIIIASFLIYVIINQRNKNKELKFIQQQQETNEEIYNLMLSQNDNIEEARTAEKKRISEELHDGILGRLFGARLSIDSLNMATSVDAINTRAQYIADLKTIEDDIRKVSHELNTDFVSGSGFIDIIKNLVENQTKAYGLKYELKHNDDINWEEASNKTKIHIYRIIQETLQNIYKHAEANLVKISFDIKNGVFCLAISDDGSGFDVNKAKSGIGIKNIKSRVHEINGDLSIDSEINRGTTIVIKVNTT